jgi:F-type H+-transporting ATPase subunit gamma
MAGQMRVYRRRMRSIQSTKKIMRAMELISASRIIKAQQRVAASTPYANQITAALSAAASSGTVDHPWLQEKETRVRAAVLLITSDRGFAGAYNANAIREAGRLTELLQEQGKEVQPYVVGRKGISFYRFRGRELAGEWTGFSDAPAYSDAKAVAEALTSAFAVTTEEGGVDEIHIVYTRFLSMMVQAPTVIRLLPLEVEEVDEAEVQASSGEVFPLYDFEPSPEGVLDALLPRYIESRIYNAMLQSAASEHAARQRAMKSASDNADELLRSLSRAANAARQAEITQEISEIVGGADALASASAGSE